MCHITPYFLKNGTKYFNFFLLQFESGKERKKREKRKKKKGKERKEGKREKKGEKKEKRKRENPNTYTRAKSGTRSEAGGAKPRLKRNLRSGEGRILLTNLCSFGFREKILRL